MWLCFSVQGIGGSKQGNFISKRNNLLLHTLQICLGLVWRRSELRNLQSKDLNCYYCKRKGHIADKCPKHSKCQSKGEKHDVDLSRSDQKGILCKMLGIFLTRMLGRREMCVTSFFLSI